MYSDPGSQAAHGARFVRPRRRRADGVRQNGMASVTFAFSPRKTRAQRCSSTPRADAGQDGFTEDSTAPGRIAREERRRKVRPHQLRGKKRIERRGHTFDETSRAPGRSCVGRQEVGKVAAE